MFITLLFLKMFFVIKSVQQFNDLRVHIKNRILYKHHDDAKIYKREFNITTIKFY